MFKFLGHVCQYVWCVPLLVVVLFDTLTGDCSETAPGRPDRKIPDVDFLTSNVECRNIQVWLNFSCQKQKHLKISGPLLFQKSQDRLTLQVARVLSNLDTIHGRSENRKDSTDVYCAQRHLKKRINLWSKTSNKWQWSWLESPTTICIGEKQQWSTWNLCNSNVHCRCPATHWYFCHLMNSAYYRRVTKVGQLCWNLQGQFWWRNGGPPWMYWYKSSDEKTIEPPENIDSSFSLFWLVFIGILTIVC